jgi:hypothetical protein
MSHKQFIPKYCGDLFVYLFIFGGVVFVVVNNIMDWTCHGIGGKVYYS